MLGQRVTTAVVLSVLVAGCADVQDADIWTAPDFHSVQTVGGSTAECGSCHYGIGPVWIAQWENVEPRQWDLVVRSGWPDVDLLSVDVAPSGSAPLAFNSGFIEEAWEGAWRTSFEVPANATSLFARFFLELEGAFAPGAGKETFHPPVAVALVAPNGERIPIQGPKESLKEMAMEDPMAGTWSLEASSDAEGDYSLHAFIHAGMGQSAVNLGAQDAARFRFDGEVPPDVELAIRPHHDHAPFEYYSINYNHGDSSLFTGISLVSQLGLAPPPFAWSPDVLDPFWDGAPEVNIQRDRPVDMANVYQEDASTSDEDRITYYGSRPHYYTPASPIPPGTSQVRFEVTWLPPVEEPDLQVRFGPRHTPYYADAVPLERAAGRAVFAADWRPAWWDVTIEGGEPMLASGSLDIAPYVAAEDGELVVRVLEATLNAYAVRG